MDENVPQEPSGFFRVINDTLGTLAKGAESYYDVRAARGETTVTPKPIAPGGESPEIPAAAKLSAQVNPGAGMSTQTLVLLGVGAVAVLALVLVATRKKG